MRMTLSQQSKSKQGYFTEAAPSRTQLIMKEPETSHTLHQTSESEPHRICPKSESSSLLNKEISNLDPKGLDNPVFVPDKGTKADIDDAEHIPRHPTITGKVMTRCNIERDKIGIENSDRTQLKSPLPDIRW
ncbi:hypothetical protein RRG08_036318 [Elysia crispata]|uniref:Uncharacterized protein n=1 Tax=Elysia crispata TaxID=231223 RepID=A0AAE0ZP83_9GAST|nr:hypothetical protein RRG08_036318 [Elysia crispata]